MQLSLSFLVLTAVVVLGVTISGGQGASISKKARQEVPAVASSPTVVTIAKESTPSVITNVPELVPAVVDPNPTTVAPLVVANVTTTPKPDDEDDSSEEEEDADEDDQDQDDDAEEEEEHDEEGAPGAKQIYLPGYLTAHGELLVPIDAVQRSTGDRVPYEVIEDPTYPAYAQFANAANNEDSSVSVGVSGGSSAGGISGGDGETVLEILQQPGVGGPPSVAVAVPSHESSEPSEEDQQGQEPAAPEQVNVVQEQQRHLWLGGSNPTDFGFHF
ncbi:COPII coat assembly protein SEC16 isoform X2 [Folsomia candida]|uniref:COPII coat assembly protein SEC16 isoform X2 n=1 Tax=Folsomia candida TaxID=158441 RepID=UPI000B908973|nr:COPII coat assembly protein SEC16 isoform X2 [Folsomia candida]